jgi:heat shock protein HtpX
VTEAQAHLFIINPFKGRGAQFARLFMTHPSTDDRVERLERMSRQGF